jgi:hypothetical protein
MTPQGTCGEGFGVVALGCDPTARANASPLLHEKKAAEQIRHDGELIETAHVARGIDAAKMDRAHGASLEIVLWLTLNRRARSACVAVPAVSAARASCR